MPNVITIFRGAKGLNTRSDPTRLDLDLESGLCELRQAYNVDIEDDFRVSRRKGSAITAVTGSCHSLFCDGGECIFVTGTSLKYLYPSQSGWTSGTIATVTAGRTVRAVQVLDIENKPKIFWCNGVENGVIREGANSTWVSQGDYVGPTTMKTYTDVPVAHICEFYNGRIYLAVEDTLWYTRYMDLYKLDAHRNWYTMGDRITSIRAVANGLYVGTTREMYFLEGDSATDFKLRHIDPYPVVEGSDVKDVDAYALRIEGLNGLGTMWTGHNGICWGGHSGQFVNMTKDKINIPTARYASAIYRDDVRKYVVLLKP